MRVLSSAIAYNSRCVRPCLDSLASGLLCATCCVCALRSTRCCNYAPLRLLLLGFGAFALACVLSLSLPPAMRVRSFAHRPCRCDAMTPRLLVCLFGECFSFGAGMPCRRLELPLTTTCYFRLAVPSARHAGCYCRLALASQNTEVAIVGLRFPSPLVHVKFRRTCFSVL